MSNHTLSCRSVTRSVARLFAGFVLASGFVLVSAAPSQAALTQRDWMIALVDTLGWSFGLPDEPQDPDYINILHGNRAFRFEAEDIYSPDEDFVSLMSFHNFGPFSGSGWLHGTKEPSPVHLRFTLPHAGDYRLDTRVRGTGHQFLVGGETVSADAGDEFTDVTVGSFNLPAGPHEILVTLPPNGSIDFIALTAPNLAPVLPAGGWQPDETLTWDDVHTTMVDLLGLAGLFPPAGGPRSIEAEDLAQQELDIVSTGYLGSPSGGKWLRAGPIPAELRFPLTVPESGYYDLTVRAMGSPFRITFGDHYTVSLDGGASLDDHHVEPLFLATTSNITLNIPPGGGIDRLTLTRRQVDGAGVSRLLGLTVSAAPQASDLDTLTRLLAAFGIER